MPTFTSVPPSRFETDVLKTWMKLFKDDAAFSGLAVRTRHPNIDKELVLPMLVLKPISDADWKLDRISGFFGTIAGVDDTHQQRLEGYSFKTMYQFDLLTYTRGDQLAWKSLIDEKLIHGEIGGNAFASVAPGHVIIPILDFASPTSETGTETDLLIQYRPDNDVSAREIDAFDPELHQLSITVSFWINFIRPSVEEKIQAVVVEPAEIDE